MNRTWKPSVGITPAGPICPLTYLSFSFLQFVDLWTFQEGKRLLCSLQSSLGCWEAQSPNTAQGLCCGEGTRVACRSREQGKAHWHRCQCSTSGQCSPTRGGKAAGRLGEALGHSGGWWHSGVQRSCSLSRATQHHSHSFLSRVSECKGPGGRSSKERAMGTP